MRALLRATIVALTVAVLAGPFAAARGFAAPPCPGVSTEGAWTTISAPDFPAGATAIASYAVDPNRPTVIFASNGTHVVRSSDGGCKWTAVFALELIPTLDRQVSSANTSIKDIVIPEGKSSVYLTLEEKVGPVVRPHIAVSDDSGVNWQLNNTGLTPASGGILSLVAAPSNARVMYLLLRSNPVGAENALYASTDGGATWEQRSEAADGSSNLAVDPLAPDDLWLWGGRLMESKDGGRTRAIHTETHNVSMADVSHTPGTPARVMGYEPETQTMVIVTDGSSTWTRIFGPQTFSHSMTNTGGGPFDVVVAGNGGVFQMVAPEFWVAIDPPNQPDIYDLQSTRVGPPLVFGYAPETNELVRYEAQKVDVDPFTTVSDGIVASTTELSPKRKTVKLKPGESRTVRYNLGLPPHPTPLDVFFLVDTSNSMESTINGLREGMQQVIDELEDSRMDVHFGVGEFKDYPIPGFGNPEAGDFPYRLNRSIGPAGPELAEALEKLEASGGGADPRESQLTGLYQAATGDGEPGFVPAGQDAGFRPAALKVIVHITDAAFHTDPAHPSPPWATVVDALTTKGIL
ncbi:MAG TPA: hypothetical protein VNP73_08490, partial [Actinomycetota bacterium]|nr:hypothetical protein [Actinomycetota bacterium]